MIFSSLQLPEAIIPKFAQTTFLKIAQKYTLCIAEPVKYHKEIVHDLKEAMKILHDNHYWTLRYIIHHLKKMSLNYKINKMNAETISSTIAPFIFQTL